MMGDKTLAEIKEQLRIAFMNADGDPLNLKGGNKRNAEEDNEVLQSLRRLILSARKPAKAKAKRPA